MTERRRRLSGEGGTAEWSLAPTARGRLGREWDRGDRPRVTISRADPPPPTRNSSPATLAAKGAWDRSYVPGMVSGALANTCEQALSKLPLEGCPALGCGWPNSVEDQFLR